MPYAAVGDVLLHYRLWGREGRRVALVHGSWGSHKSSEALADALAGECVVLAYDRRGHDASDAPPGPGSLADDVADLAGLLTVLEMAPAWLVGNSLGGLIALRTAAAHPHACLGVAAHEPPVYALAPDAAAGAAGPADETLAEVAHLIETGDHAGAAAAFIDRVALGPGGWERLRPQDRDSMTRNAPTFLDELHDPEVGVLDAAALRRFGGPVLLTVGDRSPAPMRQPVAALASALPSAAVVTLDGAGHVPHLTHFREYATLLNRFMRGALP